MYHHGLAAVCSSSFTGFPSIRILSSDRRIIPLKSPIPFLKQEIRGHCSEPDCHPMGNIQSRTKELLLLQSHPAQTGYGQGCLPLCPESYKDLLMQIAQVSISDINHASLSLPVLLKVCLFKYIYCVQKARSIQHLSF